MFILSNCNDYKERCAHHKGNTPHIIHDNTLCFRYLSFSKILMIAVIFTRSPHFASAAIINGESCDAWAVVGDHCYPGAPHFDSEGAVCANDGTPAESYCSYDVGSNACARCTGAYRCVDIRGFTDESLNGEWLLDSMHNDHVAYTLNGHFLYYDQKFTDWNIGASFAEWQAWCLSPNLAECSGNWNVSLSNGEMTKDKVTIFECGMLLGLSQMSAHSEILQIRPLHGLMRIALPSRGSRTISVI